MDRSQKMEKKIAQLQAEVEKLRRENAALKKTAGSVSEVKTDTARACRIWSGISHEILTPLDAVLGITSLVLEGELEEEQRKSLELVNASGERLFNVLSDIIDYSDLQEERLQYSIGYFTLQKELEYDLYLATLLAKHEELEFSATFDEAIPDDICGDKERLRQVLNTLLNTAFERKPKEITVNAAFEDFDSNGKIILRFSVQCRGLSGKNETENLFDTPFDGDYFSEKKRYSEVALGTLLAGEIVRFFGGETGTERRSGTETIWFTWSFKGSPALHMGDMPSAQRDEPTDISVVLQGSRVLLAEDEVINAAVTKAILEQEGVSVRVVTNGKEAVSALKNEHYNAVLMDVQMPEMDGLEATRNIRKSEASRNRRTPVIALTAFAQHGDRERCLQAGMDDYLSKPPEREQMLAMLAKYMTRHALLLGVTPETQEKIVPSFLQRGWNITFAESAKIAMYEASFCSFDAVVVDASLDAEEYTVALDAICKLEEFSGNCSVKIGFCEKTASSDDCHLHEYCTEKDDLETLIEKITAFQYEF